MLINNFSKRERFLAVATLAVAFIAVLYFLIIEPISSRRKNINNQIQSKINMLEKDSAILSNQKALTAEYAKLAKYAKPSGSVDQAVADTLSYIESVSKSDSCVIINIKPVGVTEAETHKEILIDVSAEAGIEQFSKFLYDIENPREMLINVKRFTIASRSSQANALKGTFLISKILLD